MHNVRLSVATSLAGVVFEHITEGVEANFHMTANEEAAKEGDGGFNFGKATDEIGFGRSILLFHNLSSFLI